MLKNLKLGKKLSISRKFHSTPQFISANNCNKTTDKNKQSDNYWQGFYSKCFFGRVWKATGFSVKILMIQLRQIFWHSNTMMIFWTWVKYFGLWKENISKNKWFLRIRFLWKTLEIEIGSRTYQTSRMEFLLKAFWKLGKMHGITINWRSCRSHVIKIRFV